ncbi:hypothetical protein BRC90_06950 [Halobacteriales archaeon QS_4_69_34]|nr:MAG: hypothetical protein BRC90_06950 [Halobacteriales archaeon QS_4_69_34]
MSGSDRSSGRAGGPDSPTRATASGSGSDGRAGRATRAARGSRAAVTTADLVLVAIPGILVAALAAGLLASFSVAVALAGGSLPALAALGYVLFYDPPSSSGADA